MTTKAIRTSDHPKPVESEQFWQDRIYRTIAQGGMLHQIIYDNSYDVWAYVQGETAGHLRNHMGYGYAGKVLDAGCGYGAMLCCFQEAGLPVDYTGVDLSPDLIRLAEFRYGLDAPARGLRTGRFLVADLKALPFDAYSFDWCVCRSLEGMILENCGQLTWDKMLGELRRVAHRVLLLDYPEKVGDPMNWEVLS